MSKSSIGILIVTLVVVVGLILKFPWLDGEQTPLLSGATLAIHEAGHMCLLWAPEWIYFLGGTIFQILFPLIVLTIAVVRKEWWAVCLALAWLSYSCWDVAQYSGDALLQELPLLSDSLTHDWNWLIMEHWGNPGLAASLSSTFTGLGELFGVLAFGSILLVLNYYDSPNSSSFPSLEE